jgi:hypothetical protein
LKKAWPLPLPAGAEVLLKPNLSFPAKEEAMLDRCPTCGKTTGTLMESHPDRPGLIQILSGESGEAHRIFVTIALCVLVTLAIVGAEAVFMH